MPGRSPISGRRWGAIAFGLALLATAGLIAFVVGSGGADADVGLAPTRAPPDEAAASTSTDERARGAASELPDAAPSAPARSLIDGGEAGAAEAVAAGGSSALESVEFRGRVVDPQGVPVAKATIVLVPNVATQRARGVVLTVGRGDLHDLPSTATDAAGRFVLRDRGVMPNPAMFDDRPAPPWEVLGDEALMLQALKLTDREAPFPFLGVITEDFAPTAHECRSLHASEYDAGDIVVEPGGRLTGRVVDESGQPVPGAVVTPERFKFEPRAGALPPDAFVQVQLHRLLAATAAADGAFDLGPLWNGNVDLVVRGPAHRTAVAAKQLVVGGESRDVGSLVMQRGLSLSGQVVDLAGQPVAGARVYFGKERSATPTPAAEMPDVDLLPREFWDFADVPPVLTDAEGRFAVATLGTENQRIYVDALHFELARLGSLTPPLSDLRIELTPASTLRLSVVDGQTNAPVPQATVRAVRRSGRFPVLQELRLPVTTGAAAGLEPGTVLVERLGKLRTDVLVSAPGYASSAFSVEGVKPGDALTRVHALGRGAAIAGRVRDGAGQGLAGVEVSALTPAPAPEQPVVIPIPGKAPEPKPPLALADEPPTTALALARPPRTLSDESGAYRLEGVSPGTWTVRATRAAQLPSERDVTVEAGRDLAGIDLMMVPGAALFGALTNDEGQPAAGAHVSASIKARPQAPAQTRRGDSSASGQYEIAGLAPGPWTVSSPGIGEQLVDLQPGQRLRVDLIATRAAHLTGRVLLGGTPVAGAPVTAHRLDGASNSRSTQRVRTGETGGFALKLVPGEWVLRGFGPPAEFGITAPSRLRLGPGESRQIDLVLGGQAVAGVVRNAMSGDPVAGAKVKLQSSVAAGDQGTTEAAFRLSPGTSASDPSWPITDADGHFVIPHVAEGKYTLSVAHERYDTLKDVPLDVGGAKGDELSLALTPKTGVFGTVKLASGSPVPSGLRIAIDPLPKNGRERFSLQDGAFGFIELEPGSYEVQLLDPEHRMLVEKRVTLSEGQGVAVDLVVQP